MIEKNTFYFPEIKTARHYFQKKELKDLVKDLKILKTEENKQGTVKKGHFHNTLRIIAKKIK